MIAKSPLIYNHLFSLRAEMNPGLTHLHPYPFEKLMQLKQGIDVVTGEFPILLSIGEPQGAVPEFIRAALVEKLSELRKYPTTLGISSLREAIARWIEQRFRLKSGAIDPQSQVLPVSGTREALFAIAQALIDRTTQPLVLMPNPFYQIYEGAALLAGAEPYYVNTLEENGFLPDFETLPESLWRRCALVYLCSPGNPTGAVMPIEALQQLIGLAMRHDFVIASDECYSEIHRDEANPPPGLLQAACAMGLDDFRNCLVFHSLSKRSNVPGLRSGFVAGDARIVRLFARYRSYHGCTMPVPAQYASIAAWSDEQHVIENRAVYREKFESVLGILKEVWPIQAPEAGFYLWPRTPIDDAEFARELFRRQNVTVLPGRFLSRSAHGFDPGVNRVRIALVAEPAECIEAARRIRQFLSTL